MNKPAQAALRTDAFPRAVSLLLNIGHGIDHMFLLIFATAAATIAVECRPAFLAEMLLYCNT